MDKNFLKKNINIISLVLALLGIISIKCLWIFGALIAMLMIPIIICITIADAIRNPNSNILNFIALLVCVFIYEPILLGQDAPLYFIWLTALLFILIIFNVLKKNSILKYSTAIILCLTLAFSFVIHHSAGGHTKNNFTNKIGHQGTMCSVCTYAGCYDKGKKYSIPRQYDELKFVISGDFYPVFRAVENGNVIFINHLNENLFPNAQSVEYIGNGGSQGNLLFKIKEKNGKFGLYSFGAKKCQKYESFQKTEYNAITELIPPKYDDMEIIKENKDHYVESRDMYIVPRANAPIITIICKHTDLYDIYKSTNKLRDENPQYKLHLKNQKNVHYIGKNDDTIYPGEYIFKIDGKTTILEFNKGIKYGEYECIKDGKICHYESYEGTFGWSGPDCPGSLKVEEGDDLWKYCKFTPTKVKKYECTLDIGRATVFVKDGKVISVLGNGLNRRDMQSYYEPDKCKPVEMEIHKR